MSYRTYNLNTVGPIVVAKHPSSKKISIRLRLGALPKVTIPKLMPFDTGYRFAIEKQDWIIEHTKKLATSHQAAAILDEQSVFNTRFHQINIGRYPGKNVTVSKHDNQIDLLFPSQTIFANSDIQLLIKKYISNILRNEAKTYLIPRLALLAAQYGFKYNKVTVKDVKSRWGSCSGTNNINLNIHLMRLPEHLSDYIILHELCHTIHKNHGPKFHQLMEQITGGEKAFEKELKHYKTQL